MESFHSGWWLHTRVIVYGCEMVLFIENVVIVMRNKMSNSILLCFFIHSYLSEML